MQELRDEVGAKESLRRKLVRSWLKWVEHMERMEGERLRLTKRVDMLRVKGRRRRGRLRRRWEDCVKIDLMGLGGEWRTTARDRGSGNRWWRRQ